MMGGEDLNPDWGMWHLTKAITSLVVLRDAMMQGSSRTTDRARCRSTWPSTPVLPISSTVMLTATRRTTRLTILA